MSALASWRISLLADILNRDGVIAYPTEGVWGLGCLPASAEAVARILALKNRPWDKGLLLVAADIGQVEAYLEGIDDQCRRTLENDWPGPTTYLIPDNGTAPGWITGPGGMLGLRVSLHPLVGELCRNFGPLVSTSANISGHPPARSALEVRRYFGGLLDYIVPGNLGRAKGPSPIKVLQSGETLR